MIAKEKIIERTLYAINHLPDSMANEISLYAESLLKKNEENTISQGIQEITSSDSSFAFLNQEEDLYTINDLKEVYNAEK